MATNETTNMTETETETSETETMVDTTIETNAGIDTETEIAIPAGMKEIKVRKGLRYRTGEMKDGKPIEKTAYAFQSVVVPETLPADITPPLASMLLGALELAVGGHFKLVKDGHKVQPKAMALEDDEAALAYFQPRLELADGYSLASFGDWNAYASLVDSLSDTGRATEAARVNALKAWGADLLSKRPLPPKGTKGRADILCYRGCINAIGRTADKSLPNQSALQSMLGTPPANDMAAFRALLDASEDRSRGLWTTLADSMEGWVTESASGDGPSKVVVKRTLLDGFAGTFRKAIEAYYEGAQGEAAIDEDGDI